VGRGTPESDITSSQAAWQYACSHQSDLSELQQQALQVLGCGSGRALMYAAGYVLRPLINSNRFEEVTNAYLQLAEHWPPLPQLDQTQQFQQFTEALAQHKEGDCPPCGSRLLPCASLLWLVPALLLEWAQKQPADWACAGMCHQVSSRLLWVSLQQVRTNQQFWALSHSGFCDAARHVEEQHVSVSSTLTAASKVALGFSKGWAPSASRLGQLLHLMNSVAAQLLAGTQDTGRVTIAVGSTAAAGSSGSGASAISRVTSDMSSSRSGPDSASSSHDDVHAQQHLSLASLSILSPAYTTLCDMVHDCLWDRTHNSAASPTASSSFAGRNADEASGVGQQATLTVLCSALQQTLPQQASMTEAALRSSANSVPCIMHPVGLMQGGDFIQQLCAPGLFVAAGLQPGSLAAKALCSLSFTLVKLTNATILAKPQPDEETILAAIKCLRAVVPPVVSSAMFVKAACASSKDDSNSQVDEAIRMLSHVKNARGSPWGEDALALISSSTGGTTSTSSDRDAVALVPWLVLLGRCCTAYALVLQHPGSAAGQAAAQSSQQIMWDIAQGLQEVFAALSSWLRSSSVSAQLAAAGCSTQRVIELLQSVVQAGQDAPQAGAAAGVAPELLLQLGSALSNLPVGTACNNPHCTSLAGLSEQQLVVGRARLCAGCLMARYCCRACQVVAWKQHRPACKAVASARATKAAEQVT
jgi:hypothetical protein